MLEDLLARALPAVERQQDDGGVDHEDVEGHLKCMQTCQVVLQVNFGFTSSFKLKLIFPKAVNGLRGKLFAFLVLLKFQTLSGYYVNATRDYDITWTMPQCVLCLRLIGLAFDIWDGTKPKESLSKDQVRHHCILCFVFEAHWAGV